MNTSQSCNNIKTSSYSSLSNDLIKSNQTSSRDDSKLSTNEKSENQCCQEVTSNESHQSQTCKSVSLDNDLILKQVQHHNLINEKRDHSMDQFCMFYFLKVHLRKAKNLLAKDITGKSDPYLKFKYNNKQVYRSETVPKSLNPTWDEYFSIFINDLFQPVLIKAYDKDFGFSDDYLGSTSINLNTLKINEPTELVLHLSNDGASSKDTSQESWSKVYLTVTLVPKLEYFKNNAELEKAYDSLLKKGKRHLWDCVVHIILIEGRDLIKDKHSLHDLYVKFKLGTEKYKSKVVAKTVNPVWNEQFDFHSLSVHYEILEMSVYNRVTHGKDEIVGKATICLKDLEKDQTHCIWKNLEHSKGSIGLMVTISGIHSSDTFLSLDSYSQSSVKFEDLINRYSLKNTFQNLDDVGLLLVKVYRAEGLMAADISGKSDPFCVLELVNTRLQTDTQYKTLCPEWNKFFIFEVGDIHETLEVTVYDENRDKKVNFLGKVAIPLCKIENDKKKWYILKDKKLLNRTKGRIFLELSVFYNQIRACLRTFSPKESKLIKTEQKFKMATFVRNLARVKTFVMEIVSFFKHLNSYFEWEHVPRSFCALLSFLLFTYYFELYMIPLVLLIFSFKHYLTNQLVNSLNQSVRDDEIDLIYEPEPEDDEERDKMEEKKTWMKKFQTAQETIEICQNILGELASFVERAINIFYFKVPLLSWMALLCLFLSTFVLYFVPLRYLVMFWGLHKFTKKWRHVLSNNELFDFISHAPDYSELATYRELNDEQPSSNPENRKIKKK